jgi:hypothetical protein
MWYGEGEVKVYRDGDGALPTLCGTGLEDYVGSAWGLGAHAAPYGGAPLVVTPPGKPGVNPDFVGFYRWHVADPIMFARSLRVTIQQIGAMHFLEGQEAELARYERTNPVAGEGWLYDVDRGIHAWGLAERVDDFCATAYVYCTTAQPVARVDVAAALADIGRRDYEARPGSAAGGAGGPTGASLTEPSDPNEPSRIAGQQPIGVPGDPCKPSPDCSSCSSS